MHNKSSTVDNQMTLIGGRNIADEYFAAWLDVSFGDPDVVSIGPIVADVSEMFDVYWNSRAAVTGSEPAQIEIRSRPEDRKSDRWCRIQRSALCYPRRRVLAKIAKVGAG